LQPVKEPKMCGQLDISLIIMYQPPYGILNIE